MEITVKNLQTKVRLNSPQIIRSIKTILKSQKISNGSLAVVFVSRQKIQGLNQKFLKRRTATDVLAFEFREFRGRVPKSPPRNSITGDIFISVDAAVQNARIYRTTVQREMILYMVHGILHLLGYDDHSPANIQRMRKKEEEILGRL